jgi:hypothetical protein
MPHAATDSVSDSSVLASDISGFVSSIPNLFDQYKTICRCRMYGMNSVAQDLTGGEELTGFSSCLV